VPDGHAVRVLLADDHALVRSGLVALLKDLPGVVVVGEAGDGAEALRLAGTLHPDVVLMDVTMPGLNGIDATARLARDHPTTRVLILSMHADEEYVAQALRAGAAGYLLKNAERTELELAIHAVARGETYLTPIAARPVVADYLGRGAPRGGTLALLTPRQREVLQLIAEGYTTKAMAHRLGLSAKTVEAHRTKLMQRLGIHDVPGLVRYAVRAGLVSPDR
jgi:DNA-binding NarL/FixJ family response regulator